MSSPTLDRAIGPVAATLLVIGGIIGSGIFLTTGLMAASLPSPALILTAWALGGLFALAGALSYAELAAMFPRAGGVYVYLREAFGSLPAFLYGWAMLLVALSGGVAAVAVGFADYLSYFFPSLSPAHVLATVPIGSVTWTLTAAKIVAVLSIVALGGINYLGVRSGVGHECRPDRGQDHGAPADPDLRDRRDARLSGVDAHRPAGRARAARRLRRRDDCGALGQ